MKDQIELDEKFWLRTRRNDAQGSVFELWRIEYRNPSGGSADKYMGVIFTYYDSDLMAEGTVPHWIASLMYPSDEPLPETLPKTIGNFLLKQTACTEPMGLGIYLSMPFEQYPPNVDCFHEFGEVFMED